MLVSLILKSIDLASGPLRSVAGSLVSMAGATGDANTATGTLRNAFTQGILQANLYGAAIGQVQKGLGFFNSKVEEARSIQLKNTEAASTFSAMTGQSFDAGTEFIDKMNIRLGKSASTLPGATKDYKMLATAIQDNVLGAFKSASGIDMAGFENSLATISESYGALSAAGGVPVQNTMLGLTKALGGASTASLRQIQFFEGNQKILDEIDRRLKALGKSTLADLNMKDRVKLIEEVGKKYITEDFKRQSAQSVDGLIQSFNDSLFGTDSGIFGMMRDLDPNTKGAQSAFSAFNEVLISLIGTNGIVTRINSLFGTLGLSLDPMAAVQAGLLRFNDMLKSLNAIFESANIQFTAGNFEEGFSILFSKIGELIFYQVKSVATAISGSVIGVLSADIPQKIASGLGRSIQAQVQAMPDQLMKMSGTEQAAVGAIASVGAFALLSTKLGMVERMVGGQATSVSLTLGRALSEVAISTVEGTGKAILFVGKSSVDAAVGLGRFVYHLPALAGAAWGHIATGIGLVGTALKGLTIGGLWSGLVTGLGMASSAVTAFVGSLATAGAALLFNPITLGIAAIAVAALLIYKYWEPITNFFKGFVSGLMEGLAPLKPAFDKVGSALSPLGEMLTSAGKWFMDLIKPVKDTDGSARNLGETLGKALASGIVKSVEAIASLVDWLGKAFNSMGQLIDRARQMPVIQSMLPGGADTAALPPTPIARVNNALGVANAFANPAGAALSMAGNLLFGGARFMGNVPNAVDGLDAFGLIKAIRAESRAKPPGSQLVVANTSELILNREQQSMLRGGTPTVTAPATSVVAPLTPTVVAPPPVAVPAPTVVTPLIQPAGNRSLSIIVGDIVVPPGTTDAGAIASLVINQIQDKIAAELYQQL